MAKSVMVRDSYAGLTGPEKAAIMFLVLGEDKAAPLLERFDEDEIRIVTRAMAGLGNITANVMEELIRRFTEQFAKGGSVVGTFESTERMLSSFLPNERVDEIMGYIRGPAGRTTWEKLSSVSETMLAKYLTTEHPQTVAVVLSKLTPENAAKVFPLLPEALVQSVLRRMVKMQSVPQEVLEDVEETLHKELMLNYALTSGPDTHEQLAEIFNRIDPNMVDTLFEDMSQDMPDEVNVIKNLMFTFEDLIELDKMSLTTLIRNVDNDTLTYALKGSRPQIRDIFLGHLSERAGNILRDSLETMGPVLSRDVEGAKSTILKKAKELADGGQIIISRGEDPDNQVIY